MDEKQLNEIRQRAEAATPGPWVQDIIEGWYIFPATGHTPISEALVRSTRKEDAAFIAHAREDVPALLAEIERLGKREAAALEIVRAMANAPVVSWHQNWIPETGDSLPRMNAIEIEEHVCQRARKLLSEGGDA